VFVFLKLPESWKLLKTSMSPECNALGRDIVGNGFRWITSGFIHAILVNEQENQAYPLFLEVKELMGGGQALEIIRKRFEKLVKKGKEEEMEKIRANGHEAQYIVWTGQKKIFLKRRAVILVHLEYATYCNATRRLLLFRISSSQIENFRRDKERMLSILSSLTCHF
ncbi:MAG: hypothetical protein ACPLYF_00435, partial [Fervidobacterium sp.]